MKNDLTPEHLFPGGLFLGHLVFLFISIAYFLKILYYYFSLFLKIKLFLIYNIKSLK